MINTREKEQIESFIYSCKYRVLWNYESDPSNKREFHLHTIHLHYLWSVLFLLLGTSLVVNRPFHLPRRYNEQSSRTSIEVALIEILLYYIFVTDIYVIYPNIETNQHQKRNSYITRVFSHPRDSTVMRRYTMRKQKVFHSVFFRYELRWFISKVVINEKISRVNQIGDPTSKWIRASCLIGKVLQLILSFVGFEC